MPPVRRSKRLAKNKNDVSPRESEEEEEEKLPTPKEDAERPTTKSWLRALGVYLFWSIVIGYAAVLSLCLFSLLTHDLTAHKGRKYHMLTQFVQIANQLTDGWFVYILQKIVALGE